MNICRESKITFSVNFIELFSALRKQFPKEFILNGFPTDPKLLTVEALPNGVSITGIRRSQGPAEIEFNRMQRRVDGDGE